MLPADLSSNQSVTAVCLVAARVRSQLKTAFHDGGRASNQSWRVALLVNVGTTLLECEVARLSAADVQPWLEEGRVAWQTQPSVGLFKCVLCEQPGQALRVDRLCEVMVESCCCCSAQVFALTPSRRGDEHG